MGNGVSQAVLGFVLTFWPAPLVGFGTWAIIQHNEPRPVYEAQGTQWGRPLDGGSSTLDRIDPPPPERRHYVPPAPEPERLDYGRLSPDLPEPPAPTWEVPTREARKPIVLPGV